MRKVEHVPEVGRTWFEVEKFPTIGTRLHDRKLSVTIWLGKVNNFAIRLKRHRRTGCGRDIRMHRSHCNGGSGRI
jgi:hypothetical protein